MNKVETLIRENNTLRVLLIAVATLMIGIPLWYLHTLINEPFAVLVRALAETILIAGFVGIIYELVLKRRFEEEMQHAIIQAINVDKGLLKEKKFKDETVDSIIKNCFEAKLCNESRANALYDGLGLKNLNEELFRNEFNYKIWLKELSSDMSVNGFVFKAADYFEMREVLKYQKRLHLKKKQELIVGLCFEEKHLEHYKGKDCLYRTILRIDYSKETLLEILKKSPKKILDIFTIDVKINGVMLDTPLLNPYDNDKGIEIIYLYNESSQKGATVEITTKTIRDKSINFYSAYLYDPTLNPEITLNYCKAIKDVFPIAYFTSKSRGVNKEIEPSSPDPSAEYCTVRINEWVFPTSGIVFVWKACK